MGGFEYRRNYLKKFKYYAAKNRPGVQRFRLSSDNQLADQIRNVRELDPSSFIIAYPHWGGARNYAWAGGTMFDVNTSFLKAGADLVLGHGSHMMQQCWVENGQATVFSLGNFVFNSPGRYQKLGVPPYSLVARLKLVKIDNRWSYRLRLYPIVSDNRRTLYQPRPVTEEEMVDVYNVLTAKGQRIFQQEYHLGQDGRGYFLEKCS